MRDYAASDLGLRFGAARLILCELRGAAGYTWTPGKLRGQQATPGLQVN
jgi:hypothetical protein